MDGIREYLLQVTAAAIVCAIATGLTDQKNMSGKVIQLLAGFFMALAVVGPWMTVRLDFVKDFTEDISSQADRVVAEGEKSAKESMAEIIKEKTKAYILDKAKALGAVLTVEVTLDWENSLLPCGVRLKGNVSPYAKRMLTDIIEKDLGIRAEEQKWIGQT